MAICRSSGQSVMGDPRRSRAPLYGEDNSMGIWMSYHPSSCHCSLRRDVIGMKKSAGVTFGRSDLCILTRQPRRVSQASRCQELNLWNPHLAQYQAGIMEHTVQSGCEDVFIQQPATENYINAWEVRLASGRKLAMTWKRETRTQNYPPKSVSPPNIRGALGTRTF